MTKEKNVRFEEFDTHLMQDKKPSDYFNQLARTGFFHREYPFTLLGELIETQQSPLHHPEGSVWNHTMLVVDHAAELKHLSSDPGVFMWSALLHDLGKGTTTKVRKGKITSYDHDKEGKALAVKFLKALGAEEKFTEKVSRMVRWHMQTLFVTRGLPFADIKAMARESSIDEVALLSLCDRLGRGGMTGEKIEKERENIQLFLTKCQEELQH
ncbi:MAG: HD domain-containing protein [Clostridia bacterium]|nr:HD domain-containing protein [Clostridia bacterium]